MSKFDKIKKIKEMRFKIGDKVIPVKKTSGDSTILETDIKPRMKELNQKFMYIIGYSIKEYKRIYLCNPDFSRHRKWEFNEYDVKPYLDLAGKVKKCLNLK